MLKLKYAIEIKNNIFIKILPLTTKLLVRLFKEIFIS
jgi:hypothetical protein